MRIRLLVLVARALEHTESFVLHTVLEGWLRHDGTVTELLCRRVMLSGFMQRYAFTAVENEEEVDDDAPAWS